MEQLLIWIAVAIVILIIIIPYFFQFRKQQKVVAERKKEAQAMGFDRPRAQYPMVDRAVCIGCGACVEACPEGDVLGVVWGIAEVINGERCVGHGHCEKACPVGALKVGLGDITSRPDIPMLNSSYETNVPGLFIVGELGGISLIRNAISQGQTAVEAIASRCRGNSNESITDVMVVGAGPAGLSAALTAIQHKLSYVFIDEREVGGAILHYPRKKLVMTQPVQIPLYGWFRETEYSKEYLMETWDTIIRQFGIKIRTNERLETIQQLGDLFEVHTSNGVYMSRHVVLALGRRGTPRKLEVPGEESSKVLYTLIDTRSYQGKQMLVVGGGDSAVEAAVGLAKQKGNTVTISYRKNSFFRVKKKNEDAINKFIAEGKVVPIFDSQVTEIRERCVALETKQGIQEIPNDFVLVQIGGIPPFELLRSMGIAFGGESRSLHEQALPLLT